MSAEPVPVWRNVTWWIGAIVLVAATAAVVTAFSFDKAGRVFPIFIGTPIALLALAHTVLGLVKGVKVIPPDGVDTSRSGAELLRLRLGYFLWIGALLVAVVLAGPLVGVPLFIFLFMVMNGEKWWLALIMAAVMAAFIHFVLDQTMHVSFPRAYLQLWFFR